jgi:acetolactate decarboxylase
MPGGSLQCVDGFEGRESSRAALGLDAALAAAVTLRRGVGASAHCHLGDLTFQLSLANVLLDGGYDGVATLGEVLPAGDHGLGTVDRLDGELVVVDGEPWRVDSTGRATLMPPETRTPFVVLTTMESPQRVRVRGMDRVGVLAAIDELVDDEHAVVAVRLEGRFSRVLVRSVPAQTPPYRPYAEVCARDEVRWEHHGFDGVFVGFRFPELGGTGTIGGLHLHGLDVARLTGGHNHELVVDDAELSVSVTSGAAIALPERSMLDLLAMPDELRVIQRVLLRSGPLTSAQLASATGIDVGEIETRLEWLADRGFAEEWDTGLSAGGAPRWRILLRVRGQKLPPRVERLLADL